MSDSPAGFPPPPPPSNAPPPVPPQAPPIYQPPPPAYQVPPPPAYMQGYQQQAPLPPAAAVAGGTAALLYQLGGPAAWSIGFGLASILAPFVANFYFYVLPIAGFISAVRAIQRGRMIGGVVGIVLNVIGGLVSLFASGLIGG